MNSFLFASRVDSSVPEKNNITWIGTGYAVCFIVTWTCQYFQSVKLDENYQNNYLLLALEKKKHMVILKKSSSWPGMKQSVNVKIYLPVFGTLVTGAGDDTVRRLWSCLRCLNSPEVLPPCMVMTAGHSRHTAKSLLFCTKYSHTWDFFFLGSWDIIPKHEFRIHRKVQYTTCAQAQDDDLWQQNRKRNSFCELKLFSLYKNQCARDLDAWVTSRLSRLSRHGPARVHFTDNISWLTSVTPAAVGISRTCEVKSKE